LYNTGYRVQAVGLKIKNLFVSLAAKSAVVSNDILDIPFLSSSNREPRLVLEVVASKPLEKGL